MPYIELLSAAGKTVRLIRGPGGLMGRADAQDAIQQSRPPVGNRVTLDGSFSDEEQSGQQSPAS